MLIYNSQKEFLGIDEQDLENLGFKSFTELRAQAADFADLFVKTPGYIHNFKHVHWIDFITCADSTETPKVIIYANEKSFRCNIHISTAYLVDNPSQKAYLITLQNMRELTKNENSEIAQDLITKPTPVAATTEAVAFVSQASAKEKYEHPAKLEIQEPVEDAYDSLTIEDEFEEPLLATPEIKAPQDILQEDSKESLLDAPLDINLDDNFKLDIQEEIEEKTEDKLLPIEDNLIAVEDEEYDNSYIFDPQIASDELGLPVDLIEEFIEDFIGQATDFKANLYESLQDGDIDNVKILSHKLKGVAANLRVENAFEALTTINTAEDIDVIRKNLNHFYAIIAKLSGEEVIDTTPPPEIKVSAAPAVAKEEEDLVLEFKDDFEEELELNVDDILSVEDSAVPQKIEIPELADDDFIDNSTISALEIDEASLAVDIETVDLEELSEEVSQIDELPDLLEINEDTPQEDEVTLDEPLLQGITIEYDKAEIADEIGLDKETFNEFLEDYITDSNALCDSIKDAISSNDSIKWQREAVKLKGMSDNMRIHSFTSELETLLNTSDSDIAIEAVDSVISVITIISNMEN